MPPEIRRGEPGKRFRPWLGDGQDTTTGSAAGQLPRPSVPRGVGRRDCELVLDAAEGPGCGNRVDLETLGTHGLRRESSSPSLPPHQAGRVPQDWRTQLERVSGGRIDPHARYLDKLLRAEGQLFFYDGPFFPGSGF